MSNNLKADLIEEMYEPDKYKTPRITGLYTETPQAVSAVLHIVRSRNNTIERRCWNIPLISGEGKYIATHTGDDVRPTPSFSEDPISVQLDFHSPEKAAKEIFDSLESSLGEKDYRVSILACYKKPKLPAETTIINKVDFSCLENVNFS